MNPSHLHNKSGDADDARSRQLVHIDLRALNAKRVKEIADQGARLIQILGSGDQDCPVCTALDGQIFKIARVPAIPPESCSCLPYCTCIMTVVSKDHGVS